MKIVKNILWYLLITVIVLLILRWYIIDQIEFNEKSKNWTEEEWQIYDQQHEDNYQCGGMSCLDG